MFRASTSSTVVCSPLRQVVYQRPALGCAVSLSGGCDPRCSAFEKGGTQALGACTQAVWKLILNGSWWMTFRATLLLKRYAC